MTVYICIDRHDIEHNHKKNKKEEKPFAHGLPTKAGGGIEVGVCNDHGDHAPRSFNLMAVVRTCSVTTSCQTDLRIIDKSSRNLLCNYNDVYTALITYSL